MFKKISLSILCLGLVGGTYFVGTNLDETLSDSKTLSDDEGPRILEILPDEANMSHSGTLTCPGTSDIDASPSILLQNIASGEDLYSETSIKVQPLNAKSDAEPKNVLLRAGERTVLTNTQASLIEWSGAPLYASVIDSINNQNSRLSCVPNATDVWDLLGFDTRLGTFSTLVITNPTTTPAQIKLSFSTPTGPVSLASAANIDIPALDTVTLDLAEFLPNEEVFGVRVEANRGRIVASGEITKREVDDSTTQVNFGAVTGRARVIGVPFSGSESFVPAVGKKVPGLRQQLLIANPLSESIHARVIPSQPAPLAGELSAPILIPAGAITQFDVTDLSTIENPSFYIVTDKDSSVVSAIKTVGERMDLTSGVSALQKAWSLAAVDGSVLAISSPHSNDTDIVISTKDGVEKTTISKNNVYIKPSPADGTININSSLPVLVSLRTPEPGWSVLGLGMDKILGRAYAPIPLKNNSLLYKRPLSKEEDLGIDTPLVPKHDSVRKDESLEPADSAIKPPTELPQTEQPVNTDPLPAPTDLPAPVDQQPEEVIEEDIFG